MADAPLPGDRAWAVLHANAPDTEEWQPRRNFLVVASGPRLAQIHARTEANGHITLTHPDADPTTIDPERDGEKLKAWISPLWDSDRPAPARLVRAPAKGMADNGEAEVAILNLASLRALSDKLGQDLDIGRFRGNLVVDGLGPWGEFDLIGRSIRLGGATLEVTRPTDRCRAPDANPLTGRRDANVLRALEDGWGHRDFGVYARVSQGGRVRAGDELDLI